MRYIRQQRHCGFAQLPLLLVLGVLIVGGGVLYVSLRQEAGETVDPIKTAQEQARSYKRSSQELLMIEGQLRRTLKENGGIGPDTYRETEAKLDRLEARGEDVSSARGLLAQFTVGGTESPPVDQKLPEKYVAPEKSVTTVPAEPAPAPTPPSSEKNSASLQPEKRNENLVLQNIGLNLGVYDPATGKAGDFLFTRAVGDHYANKALLEFGATLTGPGGTDVMPHPTYFVPRGTKVIAPVSGKIDDIRFQAESGGDYEVVIVPTDAPSWRVGLDHIMNLTVKEGDTVQAGAAIAEVGASLSSAIPPELGWVEVQIWKASGWGGDMTATCPFMLLDESIKSETAVRITAFASEWEKFLGKDVYKQESWVFPGCLASTAKA